MIYTPATRLALQIAEEAHRGQTDSAGFPYILHPILVAEQQKIEAAVVAALLHDVCEDCGITLKELLDRGVPKEAVEAVRLLTHRKGCRIWTTSGRCAATRSPWRSSWPIWT